tara:strand:+ start:120 stop:1724 length:1605 start_codon:yes stop_codon:yes gene_type:complete
MILKNKNQYTDNQGKTIQIFPSISIFEIPDEALTNNYVGYIYEHDLLEDVEVFGKLFKKGTFYRGAGEGAFGYHKKDGVYWHSSQCKYFNAIWYGNKKILRFRIVKIYDVQSSWTAVKNEESKMLQDSRATQSENSFNGNNGFPEYETFDKESVKSLVALIKEQQFMYDTINKVMVDMKGKKHFPESEVTVQELCNPDTHDRAQPRRVIVQETKTIIKDKVKSHGLAKVKKVIRFMNWKNSGLNLIIDKNTTVLALFSDKELKKKKLKTIDVQYEYHKNMTLLQAKHAGNILNDNADGINSYVETSIEKYDASKFLYDLYYEMKWDKDDLDLKDHNEIHSYLNDYESLTSKQKTWAIGDAWEQILQFADSLKNKHTKNWNEDANMIELDGIIKKYENLYPQRLIVVLSTSSMSSWHEELNKRLYEGTQGKFKKITKRKNPTNDGYNYNFTYVNGQPKTFQDILILPDGRGNISLYDEFKNGKKVYDKKLKKYIRKTPNWTNFQAMYEVGSIHSLDHEKIDFYESDNTITKIAAE